MTPTIVPGLGHRMGLSCILSSIRTVMRREGHDYSEDLIYGLGSGLNFWYSNANGLQQIAGIGTNLFNELQAVTHIHHAYACFDDKAEAARVARAYIDHGIPVACDVELITYLPHLRNAASDKAVASTIPLDSDLWNFRVGGHLSLLVGYDSESYYVHENLFQGLLKVPRAVFELARDKTVDFMPSCNGTHVFFFPGALPDMASMVRQSIGRVVHNMRHGLKPPAYCHPAMSFSSSGLKGIADFFTSMRGWKDLAPEALHHLVYTLNQVVNRFGNNEVNRITYSRFLGEASRLTGDRRLVELAAEYAELSRSWKGIQRYIAAAVKDRACLEDPNLPGLQDRILTHEHDLVDRLESYVKGDLHVHN